MTLGRSVWSRRVAPQNAHQVYRKPFVAPSTGLALLGVESSSGSLLRSRAPAPDEEPIAWAEGRGAAFPQEHAGVDRGGAARDRA